MHNKPIKITRNTLISSSFLSLSHASQILLIGLHMCADKAGLVDSTAALKLFNVPESALNDLCQAGYIILFEGSPVVAIRHWFKAYPEYNNGHTLSDYPELQCQLLVEKGIYAKKV